MSNHNQQNQSFNQEVVEATGEVRETLQETKQQVQDQNKKEANLFDLPEQGFVWRDVEKSFLFQALQRSQGNQCAAARLLGLSRYAVRYRMMKFGFDVRGNQGGKKNVKNSQTQKKTKKNDKSGGVSA